jgi:GH15 family glucan-1,4-alpha-glucosidase
MSPSEDTSEYPPIEAHGVIGDLQTCALVSRAGTVDWCPFPGVESPSVFASILDAERGGHFTVTPETAYDAEQSYVDRTNVLQTTFTTEGGEIRLTDFMVPTNGDIGADGERALYRKVEGRDGAVPVGVSFRPRFDYGRAKTTMAARDETLIATTDATDDRLTLSSSLEFEVGDAEASATASLTPTDTYWFVTRYNPDEGANYVRPERVFENTVEFWHDWVHTCDITECIFEGAWHDLAVRSGLTLKLLTHDGTGGICAAPTTSLPEDIGGVRNWDYRYNWIRDAAFTVQAMVTLGHTYEAMRYVNWFLERCHANEPAEMQPLYGLHGETELSEAELDHFDGYRGSEPVRIGNGAAKQRQLDTYGELLLAVSETARFADIVSEDDWEALRGIVEYVCDVWQEKDAGIWEVRDGPKQFVFSKVMCWVALDRGIAMTAENGFDAPTDRWRDVRDRIKSTVLENGYDEEAGYFLQAFEDEDTIDATGLLIPVVGFLPVDDERVQRTIDAIQARLTSDDGLVKRYDGEDGLPGEEGAFLWCSFWLVDALALSGRVEEAEAVFTSIRGFVNEVGLLSEEIDPRTGAHLGNFPQGFSHIGLINSALYLAHAKDGGKSTTKPMGMRLGDGISLGGTG